MQISQFVKGKRKNLGLTQIDLAEKSGVGLRFVRDLEQGKASLSLDMVNQILAFAMQLSRKFIKTSLLKKCQC